MSAKAISEQIRARILASSAALFCLSLVVGLVFTFKAIGHVVAWPLIPDLQIDIPGTEAAWRRAHLGGVLNALAMIAFAMAGANIRLGATAQKLYEWFAHITGWGNTLAFLIGALFGARGLAFGDNSANSLVYLLFLIAAVTAFGQAWLLWRGARAISKAG